MYHEMMSVENTMVDTAKVAAIIEAEMIRDDEWVDAMSAHAEYIARECLPLSVWLDRLEEQDSVDIDQWLAAMANDNLS